VHDEDMAMMHKTLRFGSLVVLWASTFVVVTTLLRWKNKADLSRDAADRTAPVLAGLAPGASLFATPAPLDPPERYGGELPPAPDPAPPPTGASRTPLPRPGADPVESAASNQAALLTGLLSGWRSPDAIAGFLLALDPRMAVRVLGSLETERRNAVLRRFSPEALATALEIAMELDRGSGLSAAGTGEGSSPPRSPAPRAPRSGRPR
jgi:hypothetical protein